MPARGAPPMAQVHALAHTGLDGWRVNEADEPQPVPSRPVCNNARHHTASGTPSHKGRRRLTTCRRTYVLVEHTFP